MKPNIPLYKTGVKTFFRLSRVKENCWVDCKMSSPTGKVEYFVVDIVAAVLVALTTSNET